MPKCTRNDHFRHLASPSPYPLPTTRYARWEREIRRSVPRVTLVSLERGWCVCGDVAHGQCVRWILFSIPYSLSDKRMNYITIDVRKPEIAPGISVCKL